MAGLQYNTVNNQLLPGTCEWMPITCQHGVLSLQFAKEQDVQGLPNKQHRRLPAGAAALVLMPDSAVLPADSITGKCHSQRLRNQGSCMNEAQQAAQCVLNPAMHLPLVAGSVLVLTDIRAFRDLMPRGHGSIFFHRSGAIALCCTVVVVASLHCPEHRLKLSC